MQKDQMANPSEFDANSVIVTAAGGEVDVVAADGEVLATIAVPPGRTPISRFLDLLPEGAHFEAGTGVAVLQRRHRVVCQPYGEGSHESGANPDFQPTSASRMELEMRRTLSRMQAATSRVEARERALANIERIPPAPAPAPAADAPDGSPVVE